MLQLFFIQLKTSSPPQNMKHKAPYHFMHLWVIFASFLDDSHSFDSM